MVKNKKLNIVYVIDYLYSVNGGTERQLHKLIQGMINKGHSVKLFVLRDTDFTRNLKRFECPVESLRVGSITSLSSIKILIALRKHLEREQVDVVHGFFNDVALIFPVLFLGSNLRVFTSRRDMGIWYTLPKILMLRSFFWSKVRIICNCQAVARVTQQKEWKPINKIEVIHNGIDQYHSTFTDGGDLRFLGEKIQRTKNIIKVVLVANIRPVKRILDLVLAASYLARKDIQFFIIGHISDKEYYENLKTIINDKNLESQFYFSGPIEEPRSILSQFDLGVLCSESEGLSNTVMEYLDSGLPVVATNVGGNPDLIEDGVNGYLYKTGDTERLAQMILHVVDNTEIQLSLKSNAKRKISSFSTSAMIDRHLYVYQNPKNI